MRLENTPSYLELFSRPDPRETATGRELVPLAPPASTPATTGIEDAPPPAPLDPPEGRFRSLTPRQMQDQALDLYAEGLVSYEDYAVLAFQPELHPKFNATVGALTGETADPDRPRDYVHQWEERLAFELRHNAGDAPKVRQSQRIVELLRGLDRPTDVTA